MKNKKIRPEIASIEEQKVKIMREMGKRNYGLPYDKELLKQAGYGSLEYQPEQITCFKCGYSWKTKSEHLIVQCPSCYKRVRRIVETHSYFDNEPMKGPDWSKIKEIV